MTLISNIHNSTALTLLKGISSGLEKNSASPSQILAAASGAGLLPDPLDASGKITKILLESGGQLIVGGAFSDIVGTDGDDIIKAGAGSSVSGGAGNDYIETRGSAVVSGGEGNDSIVGLGWSVLGGDGGNDSIKAYATRNTVSGGAGNDGIYAGSANVIDGGDGDDRIEAGASNVVTGGAGNDTITLTGRRSEMGSNIPTETGSLIKYAAGDGRDKLNLVGSASTLELSEGISAENTHISVSGNSATISFDGSDSDGITVDLMPGASLTVKFSDGSSQQITFDENQDYDWHHYSQNMTQRAKDQKKAMMAAFGPGPAMIDAALLAATRAYAQS